MNEIATDIQLVDHLVSEELVNFADIWDKSDNSLDKFRELVKQEVLKLLAETNWTDVACYAYRNHIE